MALGEASKQVIVVLNIVVNAAIAIIKNTLSPIELVYRLISCFANSPSLQFYYDYQIKELLGLLSFRRLQVEYMQGLLKDR